MAADQLLAICDQFQTGVNGNEGRLIAKKRVHQNNTVYNIMVFTLLSTREANRLGDRPRLEYCWLIGVGRLGPRLDDRERRRECDRLYYIIKRERRYINK